VTISTTNSLTWGSVTDDAEYIRRAMDELGFITVAFADLSTGDMSRVLMRAAREKKILLTKEN
jgi:hypothetical protein